MIGPGTTVGDYRIDSPVPGNPDAWLATEPRLERRVVLALHPATDAVARAATALAGTDCPHLPPVLAHGRISDTEFVATRFSDGQPLDGLLADRGALPRAAAATVAAQVAEALVALHGAGLVHGAVRPDQVLVRDPDTLPPYVLLSGLPALGAAGPSNTEPVDPSASAPERINGAGPGRPADIYALGCLLWTCLTGRPPWTGTPDEVAQGHLGAPVPQLPGDEPDVRRINSILTGCLAKDPAARFTSAAGARDHLRALTVAPAAPGSPGGPAPGTPSSGDRPPAGDARGRTRLAAGVGVLALLAAAVTGVVLINRAGDPPAGVAGDGPTRAPTPPDDDPRVEALRAAAEQTLPAEASHEEPTAHTWSVAPENLNESRTRALEAEEWETATSWRLFSRLDDHTWAIRVVHLPPDADPENCDPESRESPCREFTLPSGEPAREKWHRRAGSDLIQHSVVLVGDPERGIPEVSVAETVSGLSTALTFTEARAN